MKKYICKRFMAIMLALGIVFGATFTPIAIVDVSAVGIDSGYQVGSTTAPYLDTIIGTSRNRLINELMNNQYRYLATPFAQKVSPYFTRDNTMNLGYGFNCTGFVMTALERSGADLSKIIPYPGATLPYSNLNKLSRFVVYNKAAKSYRFESKYALLNSGLAERGDLIIMQPKDWSVGYKDAHVGIFWGDYSSHDRFWHQTRPYGNAITTIFGYVTDPVYYLVKLSPSSYRSGSARIQAQDENANPISPMNIQLLDKDKNLVKLTLTSNYRYKYDPAGSRTSVWVDGNGLTKIANLPVGQYYLRQISTVNGYIKKTTDRPIFIERNIEKFAEIINYKKIGSATISAKNEIGAPISNMNLLLLDANKNVVRLAINGNYRYKYSKTGDRTSIWTDETGLTKVTDLPTGQYYLRQVNTKDGLVKRTTDMPLFIEYHKDKQSQIINYRKIGSATIQAKNELGTPISNMNLLLLDANKNVVRLAINGNYRYKYSKTGDRTSIWTDEMGITQITDLPTGQYYLRQVNTKNGLVKRTTDRPLFIEFQKDKEAEIINVRRVGSATIRATDEKGNPIRPMNMALLDANKNVVKLSITSSYRYKYNPTGDRTSVWVDANGITQITDLPTGQYYLRQLSKVNGYVQRVTDRPLFIELQKDKAAEMINYSEK